MVRKTRRHASQKGQSIAEIMVSLPFLLLIVVGLVEMGIVFATYVSFVNAAREGAVFASKCPGLQSSSNDSSSSCVGTGTSTYDNIVEYVDRVQQEVFAVTSPLVANQIQYEYPDCSDPTWDPNHDIVLVYNHCLLVDRPVWGPTTSDCPTGAEIGCPITVTVHFRVHTFTSNISLPYFGRFGLPGYYLINYSVGMPIQ